MNTTKQKQTHRYREQTSGYEWGERSGEGQDSGRVLTGMNYIYKINKDTLYNTRTMANIL